MKFSWCSSAHLEFHCNFSSKDLLLIFASVVPVFVSSSKAWWTLNNSSWACTCLQTSNYNLQFTYYCFGTLYRFLVLASTWKFHNDPLDFNSRLKPTLAVVGSASPCDVCLHFRDIVVYFENRQYVRKWKCVCICVCRTEQILVPCDKAIFMGYRCGTIVFSFH